MSNKPRIYNKNISSPLREKWQSKSLLFFLGDFFIYRLSKVINYLIYIDEVLSNTSLQVNKKVCWNLIPIGSRYRSLGNESPFFLRRQGVNYLFSSGKSAIWQKRMNLNKNGQNLVEYAIVAAVVATAMLAMSTYVFRSVQGAQQTIQRGFIE